MNFDEKRQESIRDHGGFEIGKSRIDCLPRSKGGTPRSEATRRPELSKHV